LGQCGYWFVKSADGAYALGCTGYLTESQVEERKKFSSFVIANEVVIK